MQKTNILKTTVGIAAIFAVTFGIVVLKPAKEIKADNVLVKDENQKVELSAPGAKTTLAINTKSFEPKRYVSDNKAGFIGYFDDKPLDNPVDNVFHVQIDRKLQGNETIWLEYELYGVEDYTGIAHSINDQLSVGGYIVKQSNEWKKQREQLNPYDLKKGDNVIRFTLPKNADYGFKVKNLAIQVLPYNETLANTPKQNRRLIVNQPTSEYYYGKLGYLQGFVIGDENNKAELFIDGEKIRYNQGTFESLVEKNSESENWIVTVQAIFDDGQLLSVEVPFNKPSNWDAKNGFNKEIHYTDQVVSTQGGFEIQLANAHLIGDAGSVDKETKVSITALRDRDIPALDAGMINVTAGYAGYRFLPHGTEFKKDIAVNLGYDTTKIPNGYGEMDIQTYFFDEVSHHWIAIPRDSVLLASNITQSRTNHFSDYINAIIKVPESPETQGYTPTSMKNVKAANPATGINLIQPPTANSMGNANLSYPINIPAGRQGMQPQLAISYNSGGGNGWLGLGWDLSVPSISVETRWGVPHYDPDKESETYLMGGEQLSPVAHRAEWTTRTAEKQFYPRVEGSFSKVIRHGDNPTEYWWEVTDKSGVKYYYGGVGSVSNSAVLKDANGNIAHWALVKVEDMNSNFVRYYYEIQEDVGNPGSTIDGYQIYLSRITYTGYNQEEGLYSIEFERDRELDDYEANKRKDITINARYGFKQVTADLLKKIVIEFDNKLIRSYELNYEDGVFYKKLLSNIIEKDAADEEFTRHEFNYFNEVDITSNAYNFFSGSNTWGAGSSDIPDGILGNNPNFNDKASVLSGSSTISGGAGLSASVGVNNFRLMDKSFTGGINYSYTRSSSKGKVVFVDMNGDGLPDKVYKASDGKIKFNPQIFNLSNEGTHFGNSVEAHNISEFLREKSNSHSFGIEASFVVDAGAGANVSKSITDIYLADANGDGLIDVVENGTVKFNNVDDNGVPSFSNSSDNTPSKIIQSGTVDPNLVEVDSAEIKKLIEQSPLQDVVKRWEAPFSGTISINAPVKLANFTDDERKAYNTADGVRVAIQHNNTELWSHEIPEDYTSLVNPGNVSNISVNKGDRLYFRVHSIFDGAYDQAIWNPVIEYNQHNDTIIDANNKPLFQYTSKDDYVLASPQFVGTPIAGRITYHGEFTKPYTSDDVTVQVVKVDKDQTETILQTLTFKSDTAIAKNITDDLDVTDQDILRFKVITNSNIDWNKISWKPELYYTASYDTNIKEVVQDGEYIIKVKAVPEYSFYAEVVQNSLMYHSEYDQQVSISPMLNFKGEISGNMAFTVKKVDTLLSKQFLTIVDSSLVDSLTTPELSPTTISLKKGDKIYIEYHSDDRELVHAINSADYIINADSSGVDTLMAGLHTIHPSEKTVFGPMYRQWGQFLYNGMAGRGYRPMDEDSLTLGEYNGEQEPAEIDLSTAESGDEMNSQFSDNDGYRADQEIFNIMIASGDKNLWFGNDDYTYIHYDTISSSRMGVDQFVYESAIPSTPGGAVAVKKISKSKGFSVFGGVGPLGANYAEGTNNVETEYMDMNGDRYPDMLSENKIQYTTQTGGLMNNSTPHGLGYNHRTNTSSWGVSVNGGTKSSQVPGNSPGKGLYMVKSDGGAKFSAGYAQGKDDAEYAWLDINGDGLPDRIKQPKDGTPTVALNMGYYFAPYEQWGSFNLRKGGSKTVNGGLSVNIKNSSIVAGIGLARSDNELEASLLDVNGDGLIDILYKASDGVYAKLNYGNGFETKAKKLNISSINQGSSTTRSANVGFTVGFALVPPAMLVKICVNPKVFISQTHSRQHNQISDVDGDGYPDFVSSENTDELRIRKSTIGKTNLLQHINRPLNGEIELDYQLTGHTLKMPQAIWALSEVKVNDGFSGDGEDIMTTSVEYTNGNHDRHERAFYGFGEVKTHQHDKDGNIYRSTVRIFANDSYYRKGLLLSESIQDAGKQKHVETINTYELKPFVDAGKKELLDVFFPALDNTYKHFYDTQSGEKISTQTSFVYGNYGNVVTYTDYGTNGNSDDDITANITYHNNNTVIGNNILGVPATISVSATGNNELRYRSTSIDNATGKITQIRQKIDGSNWAEYNMYYNEYGNIDSIVRPENYRGERMYFAYDYDDVVHNFITEVRDAYGYNSSTTYNYKFGQVQSTTDINGHQTKYKIDTLGRIVSITGPYELEEGKPFTIQFEYHHADEVPWARTRHYDPEHPGDFIETAIFIDGLGRVLQTKKDAALFSGKNEDDEQVRIASGKVIYDAFGRAVESYYPVIDRGAISDIIREEDKSVDPTIVEYDVLDRTTLTMLPDKAKTVTSYSIGADPKGLKTFITSVKDANEITTKSYTDVKGRQTAVKAPGNVITSFVYNAINELTSVTDAEENTTISEYDKLGRRLSRNHPDAGLTEYVYDAAGNMTEQYTANILENESEPIVYEYEYNRLTGITYPDNTINNVHFEYGEPNAEHNRAGRIVLQEDATGGQEFFYGPLGEIVKNIRSVIVPDEGIFTFETEWEYDTWNRLKKMIYPDGEIVTYNYNKGGLLRDMYGKKKGTRYEYINQIGYDKFEDRSYMGFGNGTETYYQYEAERRRLHHITTTASTGRKLMDNTYAYDKVNNITGLISTAPIPEVGLKGGSFEYSYEYDDLYRLTDANGHFKGADSEHKYELAMEYSPTGSILNKNQVHQSRGYDDSAWDTRGKTTYEFGYKYEGSKPHAPSQIGDNAYTYDANGNQTGWQRIVDGGGNSQRRDILWDEENRIRAIAENGSTHHYMYDASGERVIKATGDGQAIYINGFPMGGSGTVGSYTMYVNPYMVVSNMNFTKHFYIEGQRIVSKLGEGGAYQYLLMDKNTQYVAGGDTINYDKKMLQQKDAIIANFEGLGLDGVVFTAGKSGKTPYGQLKKYYKQQNGNGATHIKDTTKATANANEKFRYFYHPDHLGSSSYITDASGEVYQHFEYFPFGETFYEARADHHRTPYLFNGKELDKETGLYYYGARYYDPQISMFYGVDPLAEKNSDRSPYHFVSNNPLNRIDPDGRDDFELNSKGDVVSHKQTTGKDNIYMVNGQGKQTGSSISFDKGTITATRKPSVNTKNGPTKLSLLEVKGDDNATDLFEFLADKSNAGNVEWTHAKIGTSKSERNVVGTSGEQSSTPVGHYLRQTGYSLREVNHNHPMGTDPSGAPRQSNSTKATGDIRGAELYESKFPDIKTQVYRDPKVYPNVGGYHEYDSKGFIPSNLGFPKWRTNGK